MEKDAGHSAPGGRRPPNLGDPHPPGTKKILIDDPVMRVTYYRFRPGEGNIWHKHDYPHVVVMFNDGPSRAVNEDGSETVLMSERYGHVLVPADVVHEVWNESEETQYFVEVEFKQTTY